MARVAISTVGTTGDVMPYVALSRALVDRGHDVVTCSHELHRQRFERTGATFEATAVPFTTDSFNEMMDALENEREPFHQFRILCERLFIADVPGQLERQKAAQDGADVAVIHFFDYVAQAAAAMADRPWIGMSYMPDMIRTGEAPPFPFVPLGKWWTKIAWNNLEKNAAPLADRIRNALRDAGAPIPNLAIVGALSETKNLIAVSRHLIDVRADWPSNVEVTGTWFDTPSEYEPDERLRDFLAAHPKPIVVTFGSMGGGRRAETAQILGEAIRRAGMPAIVQRGYQGIEARGTDVLPVDFVPHDFLFANAGVIVHHCGSGTTASVIRSGAPSVPVPHMFDQYYWAGMLHKRGVAPRPIFRHALDAKSLAKAITKARGLASKAQALAHRVRAEPGVEAAVRAIESVA